MKNWINIPLMAERLRSLLSYDPATGEFRWVISLSNRAPVGAVAGCPNNKGYLRIRIDGRYYYCHRLAVLYVTGEWPSKLVDHKFGNPGDNRWSEIREATFAENQQNLQHAQRNNASGVLGVSPHGTGWRAQIMVNRKRVALGTYTDQAVASQAYLQAKRRLHPGTVL